MDIDKINKDSSNKQGQYSRRRKKNKETPDNLGEGLDVSSDQDPNDVEEKTPKRKSGTIENLRKSIDIKV